MSETQLAVRQPLPASKETLRTLYDECEKCFRSAERSEYRNRRLLECLVRLRDDGDYTFESFLKDRNEIYANVNRDKNDYSPSAEHLSKYFEPELLEKFEALTFVGAPAVRPELQKTITNEAQGKELVNAYLSYLWSRKLLVHLLRDLLDRIAEALRPGDPPRTTDIGADMQKILAAIEPKNSDIALLHNLLQRESGSGESQRSIALQFTDGDERRAETLLRGYRRYVKRLKDALSSYDGR